MFETAGVLPAVFCVREAGVPAVGAAGVVFLAVGAMPLRGAVVYAFCLSRA